MTCWKRSLGRLKGSAGVPPASANEESGRDAHAPLLTRLVDLNQERAAEEKLGLIRWLRPDYQNCSGGLRPSHDSPGAASDGHGPPLQNELPGTEQIEGIIETLRGLGQV